MWTMGGVGGSQKTRSNHIETVRISDTAQVIYDYELADYLSLGDSTDSSLQSVLDAAIASISGKYKIAVGEATYRYTADFYPLERPVYLGLSRVKGVRKDWITLPFAPIKSITYVKSRGNDINYTIKGDRLFICAHDDIEVEYIAGYTASSLPADLKSAILKLAAYEYEHRGACANDDAMTASGASAALRSIIGATL